MGRGKSIAVVVVLLLTVVAMVFFLTQPNHDDPAKALAGIGEPRVVVDDVSVYRYQGNELKASFSAKMAHFVEPNIVEAFASVRGMRVRDNMEETIRCEAVHIQFAASSMIEIIQDNRDEVSYAEVEDQVLLTMREEEIRTERAQYFADKQIISSREPVHIDGPNRSFVGDEGFSYNLNTEVMHMPGPVRGGVKPSAFEK
jgi:lipopolysaccharide export system protein LptC